MNFFLHHTPQIINGRPLYCVLLCSGMLQVMADHDFLGDHDRLYHVPQGSAIQQEDNIDNLILTGEIGMIKKPRFQKLLCTRGLKNHHLRHFVFTVCIISEILRYLILATVSVSVHVTAVL